MRSYLARRLVLATVTLVGITIVTFLVSRLAPGGPLEQRIALLHEQGVVLTEAQELELAKILGTDRSWPVQYAQWFRRALTLDFGESLSRGRRPVRGMVWDAFRVSFLLQLCSVVLVYAVAVPIGVLSAVRWGSVWERAVTLLLFFLYSLPNFFLASVLIYFLCSGRPWDWFPLHGIQSLDRDDFSFGQRVLDTAKHMVLPVVCLSYAGFASISRYARASMLEVIRQDYVRTARAKGLPEKWVIAKHALKNGVLPIVTLLATLLPYLLGGSVIVENMFSIPGMGSLAYQAILERDYPTVMAISTLVGMATLVGFLVTDLLYVRLDPRISLS